jgi:hypothetical protein
MVTSAHFSDSSLLAISRATSIFRLEDPINNFGFGIRDLFFVESNVSQHSTATLLHPVVPAFPPRRTRRARAQARLPIDAAGLGGFGGDAVTVGRSHENSG